MMRLTFLTRTQRLGLHARRLLPALIVFGLFVGIGLLLAHEVSK